MACWWCCEPCRLRTGVVTAADTWTTLWSPRGGAPSALSVHTASSNSVRPATSYLSHCLAPHAPHAGSQHLLPYTGSFTCVQGIETHNDIMTMQGIKTLDQYVNRSKVLDALHANRVNTEFSLRINRRESHGPPRNTRCPKLLVLTLYGQSAMHLIHRLHDQQCTSSTDCMISNALYS